MIIHLTVNNEPQAWEAAPQATLLEVLRREGYFGVKFGGCQAGECGACTVLLDGRPVNSCGMLAAQASGHQVQTVESIGEHPDQGWKKTDGLHPIQQAMVEIGAIQCGYCTPAMVLAAKALLDRNPSPTEGEVRDALSGILCRCTGYLKPVQAILRAAALMRGEEVLPLESGGPLPAELAWRKTITLTKRGKISAVETGIYPPASPAKNLDDTGNRSSTQIGKPEPKWTR